MPMTPTRFVAQLLVPYRSRLLVGALVLLASTLTMLGLPWFVKSIFDVALESKDPAQLAWLAGGMFGAVLLLVVLTIARTRFIFGTAAWMAEQLRLRMFGHLIRLDLAWYGRTPPGDMVSRIHADVSVMTESIIILLPILVRGTLLAAGSLVMLVLTSVKLTLVLIAAGIPIGLAGWWLGQRIKVVSRHQQRTLGKLASQVAEAVGLIGTIVAFGQQKRNEAEVAETVKAFGNDVRHKALLNAALLGVNLLVGFSALIGVLWLGGLDVMHGRLTTGEMLAFLLYLSFLADAVSNFGNLWPSWQSVLAAAERVIELLEVKPEIVEPAKPKVLGKAKGKARGVSFEGVGFAYPARPDVAVADGISFKVKAGQKVALVGPSGAGKTTLFSLLLRFYDVQAGRVAIDGVDVRDLRFADLRSAVAVVAQEAGIFSASVRENVAYGKPEASDDEVWKALKVAHADGFVEALPDGLNTPVGEKGVQLSGGQRQRLAIARAVLVDAPVLLLDEATSHLDAESERAVQLALEEAGQGRTVITIAHRLSTVRAADVIHVLDKGRVVASGDHARLMRSNNLYKALASLQMA